jgi:hypothetical protein
VSRSNPTGYLKTILSNFDNLYQKQLGVLVGAAGLAFVGMGVICVYGAGKRFELVVIMLFLASGVAAPLLHTVDMRHIVVIGPILILLEGAGLLYLARMLVGQGSQRTRERILALGMTGLLIMAWAGPLVKVFRAPTFNVEYSPAELGEPVRLVRQVVKAEGLGTARVSSRKAYLAYFSGAETVPLPYTDYDGLATYFQLNDIDFLYLHERLTGDFPYTNVFLDGGATPHFDLLYEGADALGKSVALYRFTGLRGE